ncbi:FMN-dependent NADH-azoreductase [Phormidesmis sp. 146-35]
MAHILHLDSSPRSDRSHSRNLAHHFITAWKEANPGDSLTYRDLGHQPVPHVDEAWIAAAYTPPADHTPELANSIAISDELIDELLAADRYVFSVPMYNLSIPSNFKAYIDQIVRAGKTFGVSDQGYVPLVHGKKMLVITSRGADYRPGTPFEGYDFQEPYIRAIFGFMGITDIQFINANGIDMGDQLRTQALEEAKSEIQTTIAQW